MTQNSNRASFGAGAQVGSLGVLAPAILMSGFAAGTLDIFAASAIHHAPPAKILQVIASGLLGKPSFHGGAETVGLGFLLQIVMSTMISAIYGIAGTRISALRTRPFLFGPAYGIGVFIVMNYLVVPLSSARGKHLPSPFTLSMSLELVAMIVFGSVLALIQSAWVARRR